MSPNSRDRAREKRRYEKHQQNLRKRQAEARRNRQVVGVVVAVLVVIGALVALSMSLAGSKTPAAGAASPGSASAGGSASPSATPSPSLTLPDKRVAEGRTFSATVTTDKGPISLELYGTKAPQTVASFLQLAAKGYWAGSRCHRLTTSGIFVLQCGDPTGTGNGSPGYGYGIENAPADGRYPTGTLAMARTSDPNSNGGQFFIVYKNTELPTTGGGYSIFGKVTGGLDIVDKVAAAGVAGGGSDGAPATPIRILKVAVTEKKA